MAASPKLIRSLIILVVTLGSFSYGYCSSIIGTTLTQPSFRLYFTLDTRSNADAIAGAINGLFQTGGLFGALSSCYAADTYGRRVALCVGSVFAVIGGALQAGSVQIVMYLIARFITGVGIGDILNDMPSTEEPTANQVAQACLSPSSLCTRANARHQRSEDYWSGHMAF